MDRHPVFGGDSYRSVGFNLFGERIVTIYSVQIREVHINHMKIEADSVEEAIKQVREGDGESVYIEYSHTLDPDTWTVWKED